MDPPSRNEAKRAFGEFYADGPLFRRTRHANRPSSRTSKRGNGKRTKKAQQADTTDAVESESSEHSFDSLFDERPAKKARHNSPSRISEYEVERLVTESRVNWANQPATIPRSTLNSRTVAAGSILNDYMGEVRNESRHVPGFGQDGLSDDEMPNVLVESEPATPHVNHSQSYQGTATPSANVTLSEWVMETNELLLAQRTRLRFALNNSATRLGRQLSSEEVSAMQRSLENIQRAVSELEMEAARHDLL